VQFITTTHSPQIIGEVEPECVIALTPNAEGQFEADNPTQAFGMDTNFVLRNIMNAPDRDPYVTEKTAEVFRLIQAGALSDADAEIEQLRESIHGNSEELQRASSTIQRLRLMGR
jgi:predicted ATP-binding protein involved in virulence